MHSKRGRARLDASFAMVVAGFSLLCCVSLACFFPHSMMFDGASAPLYRSFNSGFGLASFVGALAYGVAVFRFPKLFFAGALAGYAMLGAGCALLMAVVGDAWVAVTAGALCGGGLACAYVYWLGLLTFMHRRRAMTAQGGQALVGGLAFSLLSLLPLEVARIAIVAGAAVSCVCACVAWWRMRASGEASIAGLQEKGGVFSARTGADGEQVGYQGREELVRIFQSIALPALCSVVVSFLYGALTPVAASMMGFPRTVPVVIWGGPIGAAAYLIWTRIGAGQRGSLVLQVVFGVLAVLLLLAPFEVTLAGFSAGNQVCALLFYSLIIGELARHRRVALVFLSIGYALVHLAFLGGLFVPWRFGVFSYETFSQSAPFIMFVAYAIGGVLLFVAHRDKLRKMRCLEGELNRQRKEKEGLARVVAKATNDEPDLVCESLACAAGLTKRETEVLAMLARGRDVAFVCNELCLARNTVKGYTKRIYAKLGIHSKQELIDLVEQERAKGLESCADSDGLCLR